MAFYATTAANNAARSYEHIAVTPLAGSLGAEVTGVDLRSCDDAILAEIRQASADHLVIFFPGQSLGIEDLEAFTRRWGPFGEDPFVAGMPDHPHVVRLLKEADEKVPAVFGGAWHSDWSFLPAPPSHTLLYAVDVPVYGGDTLWANMCLAYEWLSDTMKSIVEGLRGVHSPERGYGPAAAHNDLIEHMDISYGPDGSIRFEQPLVRVHPVNGRKALYVSPGYTVGIAGMRAEESQLILDHLVEVVTNPAFVCRYRWSPGSLAVWDNRATMHLPLSDYLGQRRELWRTTVAGEEPIPA